MSGWYAMKRGWMDHEIFESKQPYTKREAWVWIVESAAYKATPVDIGGKPYTVPRGGMCFSLRFLAQKWRWSVKAVQTFLSQLEAHGIVQVSVAKTGTGTKTKRTQITLCNYDKYQQVGDKTETREKQKSDKEEQGNNIPVGSADALDPDKVLFDSGIQYLTASGIPERKARMLLGKWRKEHGTEAVIAALGRAKREGAIEPVAFIEGCLKFRAKKAKPEIGQTRTTPDGRKQVYVNHYDGWVQEYA
ncbi:hypothetical protein [Roseovarius sp.]|uniref:hypothetical protein n=1 Tax=Roseovarius sp. TaxID=1486281 RepID=UPI003BA96EBB